MEGGGKERREKGREGGSKGGGRKERKEKSAPMSGFARTKGKAAQCGQSDGHTCSKSPRAEGWSLSRNDGEIRKVTTSERWLSLITYARGGSHVQAHVHMFTLPKHPTLTVLTHVTHRGPCRQLSWTFTKSPFLADIQLITQSQP